MSRQSSCPEPLDEAVRHLAATAAPGLLEQVLDESRRQAAEIVKERLRAALVEEMERLLCAPTTPPVQTRSPATSAVVLLVRPDRALHAGWYVYGITRRETAEALDPISGVDGAPIEVVPVGDLAAVVSPLTDPTGWDVDAGGEAALAVLAPRARTHEAVLERVLDLGVVLPLRFGVMYPDIDRLRYVIRERADAFRHAIGALAGHTEWGLTITSEDSSEGLRGGSPASAGGRDYLAQRRAQRLAADALADQRFRAGTRIHDELRGVAGAATLHRPTGASGRGPTVVMRASYLVKAESADAFRERCEQMLIDAPYELRLSGELTGPWPPYHFCDVSIDEVPA